MPEDGEKNDDRNRNAQQPKQNTATHSGLLIDTGYVNAFARLWLRDIKQTAAALFLCEGVAGGPPVDPDLAAERPFTLRCIRVLSTLPLRVDQAKAHDLGLHGCFRSAARGQNRRARQDFTNPGAAPVSSSRTKPSSAFLAIPAASSRGFALATWPMNLQRVWASLRKDGVGFFI
jgi:hypothetical protein